MNFETILNIAEQYRLLDNERQCELNLLTRSLCPDSHLPIIEPTLCTTFLKGACHGNKFLLDDFEYYLYEANREKDWPVKKGGKEYNFKHREQFLKYLNENC